VSTSLVYPENSYRDDLEMIEEELGDRRIAGATSTEFHDVKLRWSTGVEEDEVMAQLEDLGLEQEALGARLENGALVNYSDGCVQYSSPDGDISLLPEVLDSSMEENVYGASFAEGLSEQYRWLEN